MAFLSLRPDKIPQGCQCDCHSPYPLASALARTLRHYRPDVVVMNYGVHWNGAQLPGGAYISEVEAAMSALSTYAGAWRSEAPTHTKSAGGSLGGSQPAPLLFWRETAPQHFDGCPRGDGAWSTYAAHRRPGADPQCAETRWRESQQWTDLHEGAVALNRLVAHAAQAYPHISMLPVFERFGPRHDAHHYAADCTHWCYSPFLWDAAIMPFYAALVTARWNRTGREATTASAAAGSRRRRSRRPLAGSARVHETLPWRARLF